MTTINSYPRETDEVLVPTVKVDGVVTTAGVTFAITSGADRPTTWVAPYVVGAVSGVRVNGLTPGVYRVWAKVASTPEVPIIDCGSFVVT